MFDPASIAAAVAGGAGAGGAGAGFFGSLGSSLSGFGGKVGGLLGSLGGKLSNAQPYFDAATSIKELTDQSIHRLPIATPYSVGEQTLSNGQPMGATSLIQGILQKNRQASTNRPINSLLPLLMAKMQGGRY